MNAQREIDIWEPWRAKNFGKTLLCYFCLGAGSAFAAFTLLLISKMMGY